MIYDRFIFIACFFLLLLHFDSCAAGSSKSISPPLTQTAVLPNGLKVVVIPNHKVPIVTSMIVYKVGGMDDPKGKSGLSHFLEHLMFRETKTKSDVASYIANTNSLFNAFTSDYMTAYHCKFAKEQLGKVLGLEADRMSNLIINDEGLQAERKIVIEERNRGQSPSHVLIERLLAAFYTNNRAWNVIGWEDEIRSLKKEDAQKLYREFYTPKNAILILTGDIELDEIMPLINRNFGKIENYKISVPKELRRFLMDPPLLDRIRIDHSSTEVESPLLVMFLPFNKVMSVDSINSSREEVLRNITLFNLLGRFLDGGNALGYLEEKIILEKKLANDIKIEMLGSHDRSVVIIAATPKPGVGIEQLESSITQELSLLSKSGIDQSRMDKIKGFLRYLAASTLEDYEALQAFYARYLGMGLSLGDVDSLWNLSDDISPKELTAAIVELLDGGSVVGYLTKKEVEER